VPIVKVNFQKRIKEIFSRVHAVSIFTFVVLFCCGVAAGQLRPPPPRPSPTPPPRPIDGTIRGSDETGPLTTFEEEMRAKRAIKMAEKDHEANLRRAKEIAEIGKELQANLKDKSVLDRDSLKKVERLEKLTKKIRSEAGGDDEDVSIANRPADLCATVTQIAEASESLSKDVQDTPRQVVSASVIGKANVLLELVRMVRSFVR
jgi:hypothetical protein